MYYHVLYIELTKEEDSFQFELICQWKWAT